MPSTLGIYALNNYLWKLLQEKAGMDKVNYGNKVPIMPAAEQVEFDEYKKPFLVYGWALESADSDIYVLNREMAAYTIYSTDTNEIDNIITLMNNAFRAKDESAANINRWINSTSNPLSSHFVDINFATINISSMSSASPPQSEGGKADGLIVLSYSYTTTVDPSLYRF